MTERILGTVSYRVVDTRHDGQRLDNFLFALWRSVPRSHVYRLMRRGEVRVNGGRAKPTTRLHTGDRVRVPPIRLAQKTTVGVPDKVQREVMAAIIYESDEFLVLNKPAGLAVHAGSDQPYGIIESLRAARRENDLDLVHRLDRDTSGCLLIARTRQGLLQLQQGIRSGTMKKHYLALLGGHLSQTATVTAALRKQTMQGGESRVVVAVDGKSAHSVFEPLSNHAGFTLARVTLHSGRTHQIRVHAQHIGLPLVGDHKYGQRSLNAKMKRKGLKRTFLHASDIEVAGVDGSELYHAPLAQDLRQFLDCLEGTLESTE